MMGGVLDAGSARGPSGCRRERPPGLHRRWRSPRTRPGKPSPQRPAKATTAMDSPTRRPALLVMPSREISAVAALSDDVAAAEPASTSAMTNLSWGAELVSTHELKSSASCCERGGGTGQGARRTRLVTWRPAGTSHGRGRGLVCLPGACSHHWALHPCGNDGPDDKVKEEDNEKDNEGNLRRGKRAETQLRDVDKLRPCLTAAAGS